MCYKPAESGAIRIAYLNDVVAVRRALTQIGKVI